MADGMKSTQILSTLAKSSYQDIILLMREPDSEAGQEYATVRSLFDHTKRVYSSKSPFLSPSELDLLDSAQVDVLRKANLATFVSSIFGSQEIGFAELNDHFLEIFVPENGRLLKAQGSLFLDLKTQAFISSMHTPERSKTELLYTLFPDDIESRILSRRSGARGVAPSEQDFIKRAFSRRDILLADVNNAAALDALPQKYQWDDFLRDISGYISKNFELLNTQPVRINSSPFDEFRTNSWHQKIKLMKGRSSDGEGKGPAQEQLQSNFSVIPPPPAQQPTQPPKQEDFVAKAARAAQIALQGHNISIPAPGPPQLPNDSPPKPTYQQPVQFHTQFQQYTPPSQSPQPGSSRSQQPPNYGPLPTLPHVSQSAPTQVLYERARQAATTKSSPTTRRAGLPSQRRPWTTEEENALMAGLDRVRGPHWSQILAMFGPGGTINESLKDRNQVQLKDKARNLKLFFLKSGIEVPYYLKYVTGDLKTRAPGQASKNEARERERMQGEEDKAHYNGVQGIMALAGANQQQRRSESPTTNGHGHANDRANDLQGFGSGMEIQAQHALQGLDGSVDANVDPNLEGIPDLPPAMGMDTELSETDAGPRTKMEA
jgi:protein TBF1